MAIVTPWLGVEIFEPVFPGIQLRCTGPDIEQLDDFVIQPLLVEYQRDLVDAFTSLAVTTASMPHCKKAILDLMSLESIGRCGREYIGLNSDAAQLLDAVLGRLGFELAGGADVGNQCQMNVDNIVLADIELELPDGFQKGQAFDIPDGTADFHNNTSTFFGDQRILRLISSVM
jgi:hypothetical protein